MQQTDNRLEYLAQIASLYYDHNKTQQEIADEFGITRSAVSRILAEAHEKGIVEHIVHYTWRTVPVMERALLNSFNLKAVRVLARMNRTYDEMLNGIGHLASIFLTENLFEGIKIGISWGTGLFQMVNEMRPKPYSSAQVAQLVGGTGSELKSSVGPLLAPMLANRLGCTCRFLHAPMLMESEAMRDALMQEKSIRETIQVAERSDIALVGVGTTIPELNNVLKLGYISLDELNAIINLGGVGLVCGLFYNFQGDILDYSVNRRIVGIGAEALNNINYVVGVAGGDKKATAIYGAIQGGYINVLITDDVAAEALLRINQENK